ncbi:MAG: TnpV protein, partial [Clostridiales bacterium]|nr:TnpV protein [Clostridiales bacterium]
MTSGKLTAYLDEVEHQASALSLRLVKELSEKENVSESLK